MTNKSDALPKSKKSQNRLFSQLSWGVVYVLSAALAFHIIVASINYTYASGLFWKSAEQRLKTYRHHSLQYQLFDAENIATADTIIIGDTAFLNQIKNSSSASNAQLINLPEMSLVNLMITLTALEQSDAIATKIVIFNAPWQWSSASAALLGGAQDTNFFARLGKFNIKRDKLKLTLIFIDQILKQPSKAYEEVDYKRPETFTNMQFQYPPEGAAKKAYHNNSMRMLKKYEAVVWVNDASAIPNNTPNVFLEKWKNNMNAGSDILEVGTIKNMIDLVE